MNSSGGLSSAAAAEPNFSNGSSILTAIPGQTQNSMGMASGASPTPATEVRSCEQWSVLFEKLNHYFREDDILQGSEHSSVQLGNLIIVAYSLAIAFGAIGNLLTMVAVLRSSQMRTVRNFFILNLALSDFFICTVTAPITLYTVLYMFWPFGTALCKIVGSLQGFNIFLSTFSIAAIALDRYVLVIFPTKRERQHNLSILFFSLIWLISIMLALPLFVASDLGRIFEDKKCGISLFLCHEQNERWQQMPLINKEVYTVGVLFVQYAFPLSSIVFVYSRIARRMGARFANRNHSLQPSANHAISTTVNTTAVMIKEDGSGNGTTKTALTAANCEQQRNQRRKSLADRYRRTNFLLIAIICVFGIAWLPLNIFHLVNTFRLAQSFSVPTFALCHVTAIVSACLNPVSYAFFNQAFRNEFATIFNKLGVLWLYDQIVGFKAHFKTAKGSRTASDSLRKLDVNMNGTLLKHDNDVTMPVDNASNNDTVTNLNAF